MINCQHEENGGEYYTEYMKLISTKPWLRKQGFNEKKAQISINNGLASTLAYLREEIQRVNNGDDRSNLNLFTSHLESIKRLKKLDPDFDEIQTREKCFESFQKMRFKDAQECLYRALEYMKAIEQARIAVDYSSSSFSDMEKWLRSKIDEFLMDKGESLDPATFFRK